MLIELAQPLKQGERFRLRLRFERAGDLEADVEVRALGARQEHRH
jgi:copper(I)-binding protein